MILTIIAFIALFFALITAWMYYSYFSGEVSSIHSKWAEFGDFFGGTLNPIFSFLGLIALLLTLSVQNKELSVSSRELANSAKALKKQSKSLKLQNFERTFFEMIHLHGSIVQDLDLGEKTTGRDCFKVFYTKRLSRNYFSIAKHLHYQLNPAELCSLKEHLSFCHDTYDAFFTNHEYDVGHYFRTLYRIFKFLDEKPPKKKISTYSDIVKAQLSSYELSLLFYNSLHEVGAEFKPLIEKYSLFENMNISHLFHPEHILLYDINAFGKQRGKWLKKNNGVRVN